MKYLILLIYLFILFSTFTQLDFVKSDVVKGGFGPVKAPHAEPFLISSDTGLHLISKGRKSYKQVSFDHKLNFIDEKKFPIQLEYNVKEVFTLNNRLYLVGLDDHLKLVFMEYNSQTGIPNELSRIDLENKERLGFTSFKKINVRKDGVAFQLKYGIGKEAVDKVILMSISLDRLIWSFTIDKPIAEQRVFTELESIVIYDTNTLVTYFVEYNYSGNQKTLLSSTAMVYKMNNGVSELLWDRTTERTERVRIIESDPMPILDNEFLEFYTLAWDIDKSTFELRYYNDNSDQIDTYIVLEDAIVNQGIRAASLTPNRIDRNISTGEIEFFFSVVERSKMEMMLTELQFKLNGNRINEVSYGGSDFPLQIENLKISEYSISYIEEDEIKSKSTKDIFDEYNQQYYFLKNFIIDDQIYSIYSVYNRGKLSSQIVRWKFN